MKVYGLFSGIDEVETIVAIYKLKEKAEEICVLLNNARKIAKTYFIVREMSFIE